MAAFSRLQLAKALIEYDNDAENSDAPRRSAEQSAIFAHLRRGPPTRQYAQTGSVARRSTDYLGVSLPNEASETGSQYRKSITSIDALRNPFGRDSTHEGHPEEEELEVDLSSWGLDAFGPEGGSKGKGKEKHLPNPHPLIHTESARRRTAAAARTMSMGNWGEFGEAGAFIDAKSTLPASGSGLSARRHSVGSPLDYVGVQATDPSLQRAMHHSEHAAIDNIPTTPPLLSIPFPSSDSPDPKDGQRRVSSGSPFEQGHTRSYSAAEMRDMGEGNEYPFPMQGPSGDRTSKFDPRSLRARTVSNGTMATQMMLNDVDAEVGIEREYPDNNSIQPRRDRPYSRLELMRPKVLVMPSPLQGSESSQPQASTSREGFTINTVDGPPLPPAARGRRTSMTMSMLGTSPSLSPGSGGLLTPNPRASMTLSQLTFRNTLMVDGQRDVAFADLDDHLRRATADGEQVNLDAEEMRQLRVDEEDDVPIEAAALEEQKALGRPAGKLFGKSLIDDLQARKAEMRAKQRVFRGDDRPSMMARTPMKRASTLIDPEALKQRPNSQHLASFTQGPDVRNLVRQNSQSHRKTLINFDDEIPGAPRSALLDSNHLAVGGGAAQTKSVFGVDTLWERELNKLKEIEAREKEEEEERKRLEAEDEGYGKKKGKGKRKGKGRHQDQSPSPRVGLSPSATPGPEGLPTSPSSQPPVSPVANKKPSIKRPPPLPADLQDYDEPEEESDSSSVVGGNPPIRVNDQSGWLSDEDEARPRPPKVTSPTKYANLPPRLLALQQQGQLQLDDDDDDSEEDLPLVATIGRAVQRATRVQADDDSSDEDKPLTALLDKRKTSLSLPPVSVSGGGLFGSVRSGGKDGGGGEDEEEDDKPLGLRASRVLPSADQDEDEDDKPLGLHPEQMRRSHMFMASQAAVVQQQQQQQMMMQAQVMHQSMMFGAPSIVGAPFYAPAMAPPMMLPPPQLPSTPPPVPDAVKLNRVDKWRHDVAVEGDD